MLPWQVAFPNGEDPPRRTRVRHLEVRSSAGARSCVRGWTPPCEVGPRRVETHERPGNTPGGGAHRRIGSRGHAVKIRSVAFNNRRKGFEVRTARGALWFPYGKLEARPTPADPVVRASVDPELGREGFTYQLRSGKEGTVHIEQVLEYNQDPDYLRDVLLYKLTLEAQKRVEASPLSKREIIR